ncbi:hypothetical protein GJ744_004727 [Endocarpon pusillum]|uniref:Uncharacterized protein n=1 Tax=Endocarpon pusillum TaxID=364733 RepID=A0A8H7DZ47_9EURO|nr:hypothetical protein GJ744_004727 [Endocarpon pusillum]
MFASYQSPQSPPPIPTLGHDSDIYERIFLRPLVVRLDCAISKRLSHREEAAPGPWPPLCDTNAVLNAPVSRVAKSSFCRQRLRKAEQ